VDHSNRQTRILILIVVLVVTIIGLSIWSVARHSGKVGVKVVVLPTDSTLTIDGVRTKPGTIYFTKTTHTIKVSKQYFGDVTKTINFATYDRLHTLYMLPLPNSDKAIQYLLDHPEVQTQREAASGDEAIQDQQELSKNKLIPLLPYTGPGTEYVVDYGSTEQADGSQKLTIFIQADTDQAKQDALKWVRSKGTDMSKIAIVYQPITNPISPQPGPGGSEYQ
jgi:hypothetical protein